MLFMMLALKSMNGTHYIQSSEFALPERQGQSNIEYDGAKQEIIFYSCWERSCKAKRSLLKEPQSQNGVWCVCLDLAPTMIKKKKCWVQLHIQSCAFSSWQNILGWFSFFFFFFNIKKKCKPLNFFNRTISIMDKYCWWWWRWWWCTT